ncbi:MAG: hypothetical protein IPH59_04895 [bacterium]|nr:hypothetical protein [bacterium]
MNSGKTHITGWIATILLTIITSFWTFWSFGELYYEAWGLPLHMVVRYLIPFAVCITLTLICLMWPRIGGSLLIIVGVWFGIWWFQLQISRGMTDPIGLLITFCLSAALAIIGGMFWYDWKKSKNDESAPETHHNWFRRNLRWLIATGIPIGVALGATIGNAPILFMRQDDGIRTERLIEGNGVRLIWAPEGPGWAKGGEGTGSNLAWNQIALYGLPPVGTDLKAKDAYRHATQAEMDTFCLCRYLSADGKTLMDTPQNVWRMPTTQEVVRSLVHHGEHAGCTWDDSSRFAVCERLPDKESPLWASDYMPIYMWTADEFDTSHAYFVGYNGRAVTNQNKWWGNPRHGFRCVREPDSNSIRELDTLTLK